MSTIFLTFKNSLDFKVTAPEEEEVGLGSGPTRQSLCTRRADPGHFLRLYLGAGVLTASSLSPVESVCSAARSCGAILDRGCCGVVWGVLVVGNLGDVRPFPRRSSAVGPGLEHLRRRRRRKGDSGPGVGST